MSIRTENYERNSWAEGKKQSPRTPCLRLIRLDYAEDIADFNCASDAEHDHLQNAIGSCRNLDGALARTLGECSLEQ